MDPAGYTIHIFCPHLNLPARAAFMKGDLDQDEKGVVSCLLGFPRNFGLASERRHSPKMPEEAPCAFVLHERRCSLQHSLVGASAIH